MNDYTNASAIYETLLAERAIADSKPRSIAEVIQLEARRDIRNDVAAARAKADYQCDLESQLERATAECERLRLIVGTHMTGDRGPANERYLSHCALVLRLRGELLDVRENGR